MEIDPKHETGMPARPNWEKITPFHLLEPVKHIRECFDEECWRCFEVTKRFCYASLHANSAKAGSVEGNAPVLSLYLGILEPGAQNEFKGFLELGSPSSLFRAYFDLYLAAMKKNVQVQFNETLKIGLANYRALNIHPVDWAKSHFTLLINGKLRSVERWIKDVCDEQPVPALDVIDSQFQEIAFWKQWRAPRFIYMRPAGNALYDRASVWNRENERRTQELLTARARRFIDFLLMGLDRMAGSAHLEIAQDEGYSSMQEEVAAKMNSTESRVGSQRPQEPELVRPRDSVLLKYNSELKRAILMQLLANRTASDIDVCRGLDAAGTVELPTNWRVRPGDRLFSAAYKNPKIKRKMEIIISKVRTDLRGIGLVSPR